ncbi:MAG: hypothetical protein K2X60_13270, partial [Xanthobacteraceae bacterium]|nr:hypothetical protein [Xanthobacteraceae bacterium]
MRSTLCGLNKTVLAHHLDQHALTEAAVGDTQPRQRECPADGVENGSPRENEVGPVRTDAGIVAALAITHL